MIRLPSSLPAHYKSPLATGFTYYKPEDITGHGSSAVSLYDGVASRKGILYKVNGEDTPGDTSDDATPVSEGSAPYNNNTAEYYVVYTYSEAANDGSIAKARRHSELQHRCKRQGFPLSEPRS